MSERSRARFGLNLLAQLVLSVGLGAYSSRVPPGSKDVLDTVAMVLFFSFWFGLVYGFFRMFGARTELLEWYYQNIPFGLGYSADALPKGSLRGGPPPLGSAPGGNPASGGGTASQPTGAPAEDWSWDQLLTPRYIRFAGILLVVSAIFSFFFKIDWDTLQKIVAADIGAVLLLAGAEWGRRSRWDVLSALSFLVSYALFQFSLTLLFSLRTTSGATTLVSVESWLVIKAIAMLMWLPLLRRYAAEYSTVVFLCISYSAPFTLFRIVPVIDPVFGFFWTFGMSVVALALSVGMRAYELTPLNAALAFTHVMIFFGLTAARIRDPLSGPADIAGWAFVTLCGIYALQMTADLLHHRREPKLDVGVLSFGTLLTHVTASLCLATVQYAIPSISGYHGITWLVVSLIGFSVCLTYDRMGIRNGYTSILLHIALSLSAIGLFVQSKGAWTAVVFLLYSCVVLYASLLYATKTTKVFAFFVLTLSLLKLYLECSELFESLSGTAAIFLIGCVLLLLSSRFESMKKLVQDRDRQGTSDSVPPETDH